MPVTQFKIPEKYKYLEGFGNYLQSEALRGANPVGHSNPQVPPYKLLTERISGSPFTAPRSETLQTFIYRVSPSFFQSKGEPYVDERLLEHDDSRNSITPDALNWRAFPVEPDGDWVTGQRVLAKAGDPTTKTGLAYRIFAAMADMAPNTAFSSSDGDYLIIPQTGTLDIETELGNLLVRQNEIAVIPRGVRYRVTVPHGPARGYICELYQGHFQLPELGPIGSCGLANARDFQIPVARFDGVVENGIATCRTGQPWRIITKIANRHYVCERKTTPFDVAAWHGTYYPYKYDLGRFFVIGSLLFDHPDPSLYTVLTAPSHREPGSATLDFAIVPPRWQVMENTYWAPYYHRNTMSEFAGWIINSQDDDYPTPRGFTFNPFVGLLTNAMAPHGLDQKTHEIVSAIDTSPQKVDDQGHFMFLLESEYMLNVSGWGKKALGHPFPTSSKPKM